MASPSPAERRRARRALVQALYQWQLAGGSAYDIECYFLAHQDMTKVDRPYFGELLKGIIREADKLNESMSPLLDRKVTELTPVEHAILYVGCYELMYRQDIPYRVVINEGIELAKKFGGDDSFKYVNGILDKLSYRLRRAERLPD